MEEQLKADEYSGAFGGYVKTEWSSPGDSSSKPAVRYYTMENNQRPNFSWTINYLDKESKEIGFLFGVVLLS